MTVSFDRTILIRLFQTVESVPNSLVLARRRLPVDEVFGKKSVNGGSVAVGEMFLLFDFIS